MSKYIRFFTNAFIASLLIILVGFAQYYLVFNVNSFEKTLADADYYQISYQKITTEFDYYVNEELKQALISEREIEQDITIYLNDFFDREERLFTKAIEGEKARAFQQVIRDYLSDNELDEQEDAIHSLSALLADKYVNTIFPVAELEVIEVHYQNFNKAMGLVVYVFLLAVIAILNFQISFKKRDHIPESFMFANSFLILSSILLLIYRPFLFNEQITSFIHSLMNRVIIINIVIIIIYGLVSLYAYYELYRKRIRV